MRALATASGRSRETLVNELVADARRARRSALLSPRAPRRSPDVPAGLRRAPSTALGAFGGPDAVDALTFALHQGEWWAPHAHAAPPCRGRRRPSPDRQPAGARRARGRGGEGTARRSRAARAELAELKRLGLERDEMRHDRTADPGRPLRRAAAALRLRRARGPALRARSSAGRHEHRRAPGGPQGAARRSSTPSRSASSATSSSCPTRRCPRRACGMIELIKRLKDHKIERIAFERGITPDEAATLHSRHCRASGAGRRRRNRPGRSRTSASAASCAEERRSDGIGGDMAAIRQLYSNAVSIAEVAWESAAAGGPAGPARHAAGRRRARRRRHAEPHRARRADRDAQLRQLHVHAHGERVDPDDGPGEGARDRGTAAARVRPVGADARHRQGQDAEGDPEQARQADRRRVHDHAAARRGRRRDPPPHAGDADPRAGRRLRAPPAHRWQRLSHRRQARRR